MGSAFPPWFVAHFIITLKILNIIIRAPNRDGSNCSPAGSPPSRTWTRETWPQSRWIVLVVKSEWLLTDTRIILMVNTFNLPRIVLVVGKISDPKSSGIVGGFLHTVTSYLGNGEPPYFILGKFYKWMEYFNIEFTLRSLRH